MRNFTRTLTIPFLLLIGIPTALAQSNAPILRTGSFEEVTDNISAGYVVSASKMSAEGTKIVFGTHPSLLNAVDALRVINPDGTNETVIFEPGQASVPRLTGHVDISDDGQLIAYGQEVVFGSSDVIRIYDTMTETDTVILAQVPQSSFGVTAMKDIELQTGDLLALTGDGQFIYFINRFGPQGSNNDGDPVSGFTLYRVSVPGGVAEAIFSQSDIANVPDISANAAQVIASGGRVATNTDGSVVLLPVGQNPNPQPPTNLLRIDGNVGASSATVVLDLEGSSFAGPSISGDGSRMVFYLRGDDPQLTNGVQVMNADGSGDPVLIDDGIPESNRFPREPRISRDGNFVAHQIALGGPEGLSIRWAPADGSLLIPASIHGLTVGQQAVTLGADGQTIGFVGQVVDGMTDVGTDVMLFRWNAAPSKPAHAISMVDALPDLDLIRQPGISPESTWTFRYHYTGSNQGALNAYPYDGQADDRGNTGFGGMGLSFGQTLDDGTSGDETIGDGRHDDAGIFARATLEVDSLTGRVQLGATNGTAAFADFTIPVRDAIAPTADFSTDVQTGDAPLTVTFTDMTAGDFVTLQWDFLNDGSFDTVDPDAPVTFTYETPGTYSVRLAASGYENSDETVKENIITVSQAPGGEGEGEGEGGGLELCLSLCLGNELDNDGDGLTVCIENCLGTSDDMIDSDGDGMPDGFEFDAELDPLVDDSEGDKDGEGLTNREEFLGSSDPNNANSPAPTVFVAPDGDDETGDGSSMMPWQSIGFAVEQAALTPAMATRIVVATGTYMEDLALVENVTVAGALGSDVVIAGMVDGANNATLRNLTLMPAGNESFLLHMNDVAMDVINVTFMGSVARDQTAIMVDGLTPLDSVIDRCTFTRLGVGLDIGGEIPAIRRSSFSDIPANFGEPSVPGAAVIIRTNASLTTTMGNLGDEADPSRGSNDFLDSIEGVAVINERTQSIRMQNNFWGTTDVDAVDALIDGAATFEPILAVSSSLLASSLFCAVWDDSDQARITNAAVDLVVSSFGTVTDNDNGVYVFPAISDGAYTLEAQAPGYMDGSANVTVEAGEIKSVVIALTALVAEGEGEGEGEGEDNGCNFGKTNLAQHAGVPVGDLFLLGLTLTTLLGWRVLSERH